MERETGTVVGGEDASKRKEVRNKNKNKRQAGGQFHRRTGGDDLLQVRIKNNKEKGGAKDNGTKHVSFKKRINELTQKAIDDYAECNMRASERGDGILERGDFNIIYGNARSMKSCADKRIMLSEAAHKISADVLLVSEAGYVQGAVEHIVGYDIAANQPKMTSIQ